MESAGNAVVDFGRFLTGFLVLMGIGELGLVCRDNIRSVSQLA